MTSTLSATRTSEDEAAADPWTEIPVEKSAPSLPHRTNGPLIARPGRWLSARHGFAVEAALLAAVYLAYDTSRGLAGGGRREAVDHGRAIASTERHLHLFFEQSLQGTISHIPKLVDLFDIGYATFHLGVTLSVVAWLYRYRPSVFVRVRTMLVLASSVALVGFVAYPTAPPRTSVAGIVDTLSLARSTASSGVLRSLYNPYAAMPSIHVAYALIVGAGLIAAARHRWVRLLGVIYPLFVMIEVISTGNHFVFDVLGALAVDAIGLVAMRWLWDRRPSSAAPAIPALPSAPVGGGR